MQINSKKVLSYHTKLTKVSVSKTIAIWYTINIGCSIGEQDGLVKPKDYQGEHIVGAGEPTHMISKNLLAG